MFAGDIPRRDQPLPRFIDDADEVEGVQGIDEKSSNESAPICPNMDRSASAGQTLGKSEPSL
ncbi:MAG TPA: hypothetical protein VII45_05545, partial [Solirubrobacterales bacterium]